MSEDIIDPARPIIDPHHHLWDRPGSRYLLEELLADTGSGHDIRATVFVQCRTMYRPDGPEEMQPLGETGFVEGIAAMSAGGAFGPTRACAGIVGYADLMLGGAVEPVLAAHMRTSGRFRGVRYMLCWDADERVALAGYPMEPHRAADPRFREGLDVLSRMGLSYDALVFHTQLGELIDLADALPDLAIVLNHVGIPVQIGPYAGERQDVLAAWRRDLARLAERPNVTVKLGGISLHWFGLGIERKDAPGSERLAAAWKPYIHTAIELFGARRCMFESNFPVDGVSAGYAELWNAFKRLAADASEDEKTALFGGTAARIYRLDVEGF